MAAALGTRRSASLPEKETANRKRKQEEAGSGLYAIVLETGLGFAIGMILGLLGGGGSILMVPALVYLLGQSPHAAVTASLAIVGINSMTGVLFHRREGTLNGKVALVFGGVGMLAAYLTAEVSQMFSETFLLLLFAGLMLIVGLLMILRRQPNDAATEQNSPNWLVTVAGGVGVGALTGLLGVGGGFLIVPALVMLVGLPMRQAVGTSLIIIAMNSLAGLLGHLGDVALDPTLVTVFVLSGIAGTFAGTRLAQRIQASRLQQVFALFIIVLALFLLYDNITKVV